MQHETLRRQNAAARGEARPDFVLETTKALRLNTYGIVDVVNQKILPAGF